MGRIKTRRVIDYAVVIISVLIFMIPVLFTFTNSLLPPSEVKDRYTSEITSTNMDGFSSGNVHFVQISLLPLNSTLKQYESLLFNNPGYLRMFWNSVLILLPILAGQFIIAPLAAYGFEHIRFRFKEAIYFMYIVVMLMPMQLLLVPNYITAGWLGIRDTYWAIILPAMLHPLGVFLIRQQLKGFPRECEEAAYIDGASMFQTYRQIVRPNLSSVTAALMVLVFADNWNIVDQAVVFIKEMYRQPLSIYLGSLTAEMPDMYFAASFFYLIPAMLVFLLGQDHLTKGITLSSLKY